MPRAGALFKICNPKIASAIAILSTPHQLKRLRRQDAFPGVDLLALLLDCQILFRIDPARDSSLRPGEGNDDLVLWDFHDLLFHARSTEGRHANPLGGIYHVRRRHISVSGGTTPWPGKKINLHKFAAAPSETVSPFAKLLHERHSIRKFDDHRPITLAELAQFLDNTVRVQSRLGSAVELGDGGPAVGYTVRPYPSGGGGYELELYLAVDKCEGLVRGFYHYDADGHALMPIGVRTMRSKRC